MKSKVFFVPVGEGEQASSIGEKVVRLHEAAGFDALLGGGDLVALKTHFGEEKNENFVRPAQLAPLVSRLKSRGAKPFWMETNTLYVGRRSNAVDHLMLAHEHGFGIEATGIPVVLADGLSGRDEVQVEIGARHASHANVAQGVANCDALLVVTHATGHLAAGYGGAIKNLGMGLSSRKGKLYQHSVVKPRVDPEECRGDEACLKWCPAQALAMKDGAAFIDEGKCIGCGECLAVCRPGAITFQWKIASKLMQERMVEQALGVTRLKQGRIGYFNFVTNVGKDCDCLPSRERDVLVKAIGILASSDLVAIEHATLDLLQARLGATLRERAYDIDYSPQLTYARELGMGSSEYELIEVGA
jgi:uncharacterized Fe-S center protein